MVCPDGARAANSSGSVSLHWWDTAEVGEEEPTLALNPPRDSKDRAGRSAASVLAVGCDREMGSDGILQPHKDVPWQLQRVHRTRPRLSSFLHDFVLPAPTAALPFGSALPREAAG